VIGTVVGNFEIMSALGKGGMGEVWLAQHRSMKTKVAIKILAAEVSTNTTHVARFRNEAVAVSGIPHSGIVKIFDTGDLPDGRAYLVMEYLQGETLTSRIRRMRRLELPLIADFGRQIASVLDATHQAGITHRDLKPDNIFLVRDAEMPHGERVKVLDFGIAKLDTTVGPRMTAASVSSIGTPNYMSPEQWHSLADVDWHTDAYALGCVAFEMACGRPPFVADTRVEVCAMHLGEEPPVPSRLIPGLPPELDALVGRLLAKTPAERPTMREVIDTFTALGHRQGVALSTLSQGASPLASLPGMLPASSMQYKGTDPDSLPYGETPMAGTQRPGRPRTDDTPISNMSMQFKPTPVAGFESQSALPTQADAAASLPAGLSTSGVSTTARVPKRRRWVMPVILVAVAAIVGTVVALVATRRSHRHRGDWRRDRGSEVAVGDGSGSGSSSGSGSGSSSSSGSGSGSSSGSGGSRGSGSGSGSADRVVAPVAGTPRRRVATLPALRHAVKQPTLRAPLDVEVCIDVEGSVDAVERVDREVLSKSIEAVVATWEFEPYVEGGVAMPVCGPVTLTAGKPPPKVARTPKQDTRPERLSQKMITDGLAQVQDKVIDCDVGEVEATFRVTINVSKTGTPKLVRLVPEPPPLKTLVTCIKKAVASARFTPTRTDNTLTTTVRFGR